MTDEVAPQLSLTGEEYEPPERRVRALAGILAGFGFPGRSFERLTQPQRRLCYDAAAEALRRIHEEAE